jgi:MYXO-CTERM domain-containing protein
VRVQATVDSVNGSGVYQAGGTARIDNVLINGTAVPAPGAIALLGVAGLRRRRRN